MQEEVAKLVAAAKTNNLDNLKGAFGEVGKTCKGCHDNFRNQ
jgi:cytochrome c556